MHSTNILEEFNQLIEIAQCIIADRQDEGLSTEQFLQLCLDIRNAERDSPNLDDKNIIIPERNILQ